MRKPEDKTFETVSSVVSTLLPFEVRKMRTLLFLLFPLILLTIVEKVQSTECEKYDLKYYEEFVNFIDNFDAEGRIVNFYFYGQKNKTNSFCSDCDAAEPYVKEAVKNFGDDTVFVAVNIGDKYMWKEQNNSFRTDVRINLTHIPTLLRWPNERDLQMKTLEEEELTNYEYLEWFFFVDEDFETADSTDKVNRYHMNYYDEFRKFRRNYSRRKRTLFFFFYAEKNEMGISFCSDCEAAEPVVQQAMEALGGKVTLALVNIGNEAMWMDPENPFKHYIHTNLTKIPTLIRWDDTEKKLVENQIMEDGALEWIFE